MQLEFIPELPEELRNHLPLRFCSASEDTGNPLLDAREPYVLVGVVGIAQERSHIVNLEGLQFRNARDDSLIKADLANGQERGSILALAGAAIIHGILSESQTDSAPVQDIKKVRPRIDKVGHLHLGREDKLPS